MTKYFLMSASIFGLLACSSGGGGDIGDGGGDMSPRYNQPSTGLTYYTLGELDALDHVARIGIANALDRGINGEGVLVAVIDTGIDIDNVEFEGVIHPDSISILYDTYDDANGHGTAMAGLIAAQGNGEGVVGIAPNAQLLVIDAYDLGSGFADEGFYSAEIIYALEYAADNGAQVINMSLGGGTLDYDIIDATNYAMDRGAIVFKATGNDRDLGYDLDGETQLIGSDAYTSNTIIAVSAVDENNEMPYWVQPCAIDDPYYCLVAPGVDITVVSNDGGLEHNTDGTSQATAIASGSAALLLQYFPELSSEEVVEILLVSADDLGAEGVDPVYGSGLINLDRALQPIGTTTLDMNGERVASNPASLGHVSASAPMGVASLKTALADVAIRDEYDRFYLADFGQGVAEDDDENVFKSFLDDSYAEYSLPLGESNLQAQFHLGNYDRDRDLIFNPYTEILDFDGGFGLIAPNYNASAIVQLGFDGDEQPSYIQFAKHFDLGDTDIGLGLSHLHEVDRMLGASFDGEYGSVESSVTFGAHASIEQSLGNDFGVYAYGMVGLTRPDFAAGALLTDVTDLTTLSWGAGVTKDNLIGNDQIRFGIAAPLRVVDGDFELFDGTSVDAAPEGSELRAELGYRYDITDNLAIESAVYYRDEPGHDPDADGEVALDFGISLRF